MSKSRSWTVDRDITANDTIAEATLNEQWSEKRDYWTVTDAAKEFGGNRGLALAMLHAKGVESPSKTQINGQMRNIQRYEQFESTGVKNKNSFAPSGAARELVNRAATAMAAKDGLNFQINGEQSINGYMRNRSTQINLNASQAKEFLENPSFDVLAAAYGVAEFSAMNNASIEISFA